jgi:periplasmic protein TonB
MTSAHGRTDARSLGWLASLGLHGALAFVALILTQRMTLAPQPPAFTWRVAMVAAPSDLPRSSDLPSTPVHAPLRTSLRQTPPVRDSNPAPGIRSPTTDSSAASITNDPALERNEMQSRSTLAGDPTPPQPPAPSTSPSPLQQSEASADYDVGSAYSELVSSKEAGSPVETSTLASVATPIARADYTWLSETILRRMEELKRYPAEARLDRIEGKVVLKAIVKSDGNVEAVEVFRSSGHQSLDRAAVELLNLAAPFSFPHSLGKSQMMVKIPMSYKLAP